MNIPQPTPELDAMERRCGLLVGSFTRQLAVAEAYIQQQGSIISGLEKQIAELKKQIPAKAAGVVKSGDSTSQ